MNYVRARSARNIIPILWIKLEEDLTLRFPTLTHEAETWSPIWNPYFKTTKRRVVPKSYLATLDKNKINANKILWKYSALSLKLNQCCHKVIFDHSFDTRLKKRNKINRKWLIPMVVGGVGSIRSSSNFIHKIGIILRALPYTIQIFFWWNIRRSNTAFFKLDLLIPTWSPILHPLFKAFYRSHADLNTISWNIFPSSTIFLL